MLKVVLLRCAQLAEGEELEELKEAAARLKRLCRASTLAQWKTWRAGIEGQQIGSFQVCILVLSSQCLPECACSSRIQYAQLHGLQNGSVQARTHSSQSVTEHA